MSTDTLTATTAEDTITTDDLASLVAQRSETYGLLSRLYRKEIDQELLDHMHETLFPYHTGNDNVDAGNLLIATYLSNLTPNSVSDLAVDYTRTFIGGGNNAFSAAYPFESIYTGEKRLKMQAARDQVLAIYRSEGLDKADDWKEFEDHIAAELDFMGVMAQRCGNAIRKGDDEEAKRLAKVQSHFLKDHLLNWVDAFAHDIERFSKTKFYQGAGLLTLGFVETDGEFLEELESEL